MSETTKTTKRMMAGALDIAPLSIAFIAGGTFQRDFAFGFFMMMFACGLYFLIVEVSHERSTNDEALMSQLNKTAFEKLCNEDIKWLEDNVPHTLERTHILQVLSCAPELIYSDKCSCGQTRAHDDWDKHHD